MNGKKCANKLIALQGSSENNHCIVCQELSPGYVCLNFKTFICQECSDVHQELGLKTASIAHTEWTDDEFDLIKRGGNRKGVILWLAFWNESDFPRPTKSEPERIRDFIRKAFVVKCWQRQPSARRGLRDESRLTVAEVAAGGKTELYDDLRPPGPTLPNALAKQQAAEIARQQAAEKAAATPAPNNGLVFLQTATACFCPNHDSSAKRVKQQPTLRICTGCCVQLQTNYSTFSLCPSCSEKRQQCMICGEASADKKTTAPEATSACISRELSAATEDSKEAASTAAGDGDGTWKADFSSDGEVPDVPSTIPALPASSAPTQELGNLLDLDLLGLDMPSTAVPAAAPASQPIAAAETPMQQAGTEAATANEAGELAIAQVADEWSQVAEAAGTPATSQDPMPVGDSSEVQDAPSAAGDLLSLDITDGAADPACETPTAPATPAVEGQPDRDDWIGSPINSDAREVAEFEAVCTEMAAEKPQKEESVEVRAASVEKKPVAVADAAAAWEEIGDKLKEAVLHGSTSAVLDVFQTCETTPSIPEARRQATEEHFAALREVDFESMASESAACAAAEASKAAAAAEVIAHAVADEANGDEAAVASAGDAEETQEATKEEVEVVATSSSGAAEPTAAETAAAEPRPEAAEPAPQEAASSTAAASPPRKDDRFAAFDEIPLAATRQPLPPISTPMKNQLMAAVDAQVPILLSPQQLETLDSDHLAQMHAMITRTLQQRTSANFSVSPQAAFAPSPASSQAPFVPSSASSQPACFAPSPQPACFVPSPLPPLPGQSQERKADDPFSMMDEAVPERKDEFSDLLNAFQQNSLGSAKKEPQPVASPAPAPTTVRALAGALDAAANPSSAVAPAGNSAGSIDAGFGDLLQAFQDKGLLAGRKA